MGTTLASKYRGQVVMAVEMTYPDDILGAHKLLLKGVGNDALMAAAALAIDNHNRGCQRGTFRLWFSGGEEPSTCTLPELVNLAHETRAEELGLETLPF